MNEKAERINGWAAMIGVVAAMGSYRNWSDYSWRMVSDMLLIAAYDRRVYICCPID